MLFTLYVNDLLRVPKHCRALGYVDDTKIFLALPSCQLSDAVTAVNQDLRDISRWCCANSLLINPDKTKLLLVGVPQLTRNITAVPPVMLLGKEVKPVTVAKDLGVYIDSHLNYNEHITKTVSTCMYMLSRVNRIKHLLDSKTLIFLINAFVFSKLYYCSTVWSNTTKENIRKLQLVQNFACRIVLGLKKYDHITEGLKSLNWISVKDKLLLNDLVMVHKCLHGQMPNYLSDKLIKRSKIHDRNTKIQIPHTNRNRNNTNRSNTNRNTPWSLCSLLNLWSSGPFFSSWTIRTLWSSRAFITLQSRRTLRNRRTPGPGGPTFPPLSLVVVWLVPPI